jgi:hypothetical protein
MVSRCVCGRAGLVLVPLYFHSRTAKTHCSAA